MVHKSVLAVLIGGVALVSVLMMLALFRQDASAGQTGVSVQIDVDISSFAGFTDVYVTDTRVLATGMVTVNLQATELHDYDTASLRVYTDNDPDDPGCVHRGIVGQTTPTDTVPFKVWTPKPPTQPRCL